MPTSCEKIFIPLIEKNSSLKYIKDFTLSYNPEFIALGSVINDFLSPDMILIGESSKKKMVINLNIYTKEFVRINQ